MCVHIQVMERTRPSTHRTSTLPPVRVTDSEMDDGSGGQDIDMDFIPYEFQVRLITAMDLEVHTENTEIRETFRKSFVLLCGIHYH